MPKKYSVVGVRLSTRVFALLENVKKLPHSWSLAYLCRRGRTGGVSAGLPGGSPAPEAAEACRLPTRRTRPPGEDGVF